jgi:HSP20 family protein
MSLVKYRNRGNGNDQRRESQGRMPTRSSEFGLFPSLLDDFVTPSWTNDLMRQWFDDTRLSSGRIGTSLPAANISETDDDIIIEVAAPGMQKKDFKVEIQNDMLHIGYQKQTKDEQNNRNDWRIEFSFESFDRTFTLPAMAESEKVEATYTDGILKITVPKKEEARKKPAKTIEIK